MFKRLQQLKTQVLTPSAFDYFCPSCKMQIGHQMPFCDGCGFYLRSASNVIPFSLYQKSRLSSLQSYTVQTFAGQTDKVIRVHSSQPSYPYEVEIYRKGLKNGNWLHPTNA